ncbi:type II toxin-antitoxin system PemK/MazF family toxin [Lacticaseibacillus paracasei]|uniref:type II toxin-antitoxin system PemK/MazF family toxin n=1 Tax=Lacticaseibacillus paracasei TaxID=1597 RepID=UPI00051792A3|nr:type II toxin-antitoxin system PemK/MazF family toxin [Lacticaseibacillus paracasei]MBS0992941.1 type II toxin-antitoxin system PemK/MazF family toxin [Lacticaseibacillus paracasei]
MINTVPQQGDLIWIDTQPNVEHNTEIANTPRSMLVVSDSTYNQRTGIILGFPITYATSIKSPFRIKLSDHKIKGYVILAELLRYDYIVRSGRITDRISAAELAQVMIAVKDIFGILN